MVIDSYTLMQYGKDLEIQHQTWQAPWQDSEGLETGVKVHKIEKEGLSLNNSYY